MSMVQTRRVDMLNQKGELTLAELKPCPFCGGEVRIVEYYDNDGIVAWYRVSRGVDEKNRCNCRVFMESRMFLRTSSDEQKQTELKDLSDAWNRRVENDAMGNA